MNEYEEHDCLDYLECEECLYYYADFDQESGMMKRLTYRTTKGEAIGDSSVADIGDVLGKLAEYEDLEEQGLLLRLPCKNWMDIVFGEQETFFGIDESYIENPIREITVDSADRFTWYDGWKTLVLKGTDENGLDWEFSPEDIGKTVFLTKSEAEQKLKEMESD